MGYTNRSNRGGGLYDYRNGKLTIGDFNGDGKDDILGMSSSWLTWFTFSNNTWVWMDSNYGQINKPGNSMSYIAAYNNYIIAGDFDGSGRDQIMGLSGGANPWITSFKLDNNHVWNWLQSNYGTTGQALSCLTPYSSQLLVGDFDGDGRDDILGNALPQGALAVFKVNNTNGTWSTLWSDATGSSGMYPYRNNFVIGNFDFDNKDEILGFNASFCVKFDFSGSAFYWDSNYESIISDWNVSPSANKYLFIKTDKNLPQQLFAYRGNSTSLYSWNMNGWQCTQ